VGARRSIPVSGIAWTVSSPGAGPSRPARRPVAGAQVAYIAEAGGGLHEEEAMGSCDGRVALVTGAGQGVGQGIALALAREGAAVAVLGRTRAKLDDTCEQIAGLGGEAVAVECDVTDLPAIPGVVDDVADRLGGLDILVNNAYTGRLGPLLSLDTHGFQRGFFAGPFAAFEFMCAAHPHLEARGGGSIVNLVTSAMVRWDARNFGAYAASKQALRSLSRTAASEWGRDGIRVNAIAPHALSPGLRWWVEEHPQEAEEFFDSIPLGYIGDCERDIGRAVVMLVGPDARYLTGATIPLDGGQAHFG
jgi:NAD(P)-dependent dehydrogenase (short-subunit alcohol dehydrogenase family)